VAAGLAASPANAAGTSERIRITKVELFQVVVPMQPDIISSPELGPDTLSEFPTIPKFIVKIHTDSGIVGIGETSRDLKEAAVRRNVQAVVGKNVLDMNLALLDLPDRGSYSGSKWLFTISPAKRSTGRFIACWEGWRSARSWLNYWCGRKKPDRHSAGGGARRRRAISGHQDQGPPRRPGSQVR